LPTVPLNLPSNLMDPYSGQQPYKNAKSIFRFFDNVLAKEG